MRRGRQTTLEFVKITKVWTEQFAEISDYLSEADCTDLVGNRVPLHSLALLNPTTLKWTTSSNTVYHNFLMKNYISSIIQNLSFFSKINFSYLSANNKTNT